MPSSSSAVQHPSKSVLTTALAKAQSAVLLDTSLQIPEAIEAYAQAVMLLEQVIQKIDEIGREREQKELESLLNDEAEDRAWAEELWKRLSDQSIDEQERTRIESDLKEREKKWQDRRKRMERRKKARADEEDRLVGIHNTYAGRIRELKAEMASARIAAEQFNAVDLTNTTTTTVNQDDNSHTLLKSASIYQDQYAPAQSTVETDSSWTSSLQSSDDTSAASSTDPSLRNQVISSVSTYPSPSPPRSNSSESHSSDTTTSPSISNRPSFPPSWSPSTFSQPNLPVELNPHLLHNHHPHQDLERKSFSSDCTAREQKNPRRSSEIPFAQSSSATLKPSFKRQDTSPESTDPPLHQTDPSPRVSVDVLSETIEIVPTNLAAPSKSTINPDSSFQANQESTRSRSSSSISGGSSLSQRGRGMSTDSMATSMRTSVSSASFKPDQSLPPIPQTPTGFENDLSYPSLSPRTRTRRRTSILSQNAEQHPPLKQTSKTARTTSITILPPNSAAKIEVVTTPPTSPQYELNPAGKLVSLRNTDDLDQKTLTIGPTTATKQRRPIPSPLNDCESFGTNEILTDEEETGTVSIIQSSRLSHLTSTRPPSVVRRTSNSNMASAQAFASSTRMRAFSQPGKRPGLISLNSTDAAPPLPPQAVATFSFPLPSPASSSSSSALLTHSGVYPMSRKSSAPTTGTTSTTGPTSAEVNLPKSAGPIPTFLLRSTSPAMNQNVDPRFTNLYSLGPPGTRVANPTLSPSTSNPFVYGVQPYPHANVKVGSVTAEIPGASVGFRPHPISPTRRPFHLMKQIRMAISYGGYVSARLYVPKQMWCQTGVKLHGIETKIKLMETLINGLDLVERDGEGLVGNNADEEYDGMDDGIGDGIAGDDDDDVTERSGELSEDQNKLRFPNRSSARVLDRTERFMKRLDVFEELLEGVQSGVAKKLGLNSNGSQETAYGQDTARKGTGFGTLMAQKLGKGFDRITNGRSTVDPIAIYVETISKLFEKSQIIDLHLASLDRTGIKKRNNDSRRNNKGLVVGIGSEKLLNKSGERSKLNGIGMGGGGGGMYEFVGPQSKSQIEGRLRRVSEFYSTVVCRFVVADMGVLLDKYVKRAGSWCGD